MVYLIKIQDNITTCWPQNKGLCSFNESLGKLRWKIGQQYFLKIQDIIMINGSKLNNCDEMQLKLRWIKEIAELIMVDNILSLTKKNKANYMILIIFKNLLI